MTLSDHGGITGKNGAGRGQPANQRRRLMWMSMSISRGRSKSISSTREANMAGLQTEGSQQGESP